ncbi:Sec-independent protein translocase protein TatB [Pseudonocardia broussonetiae]|uniref:Sec-independent protein translocase protein TatB n=1 Tax=Pseudonocardia broussonetiae TaxID=2736640 RepID=A0A6M6JCY3_9PSEU|nr:Sec-independent protein translocase protein TatB [Pseudonocardia broussonetiae]QJY44943.1 Sec-independent protein translocase subunit TatB [Pseudonocardia broussonetiae]
MFDSVGWGEIIVLIVAGLFILGPERLPGAAAWLGGAIRQVKEYASGAREQLKGELGPEFDELRKPLEELRGLRNFNPRTAATRALFDDGPAEKPNGYVPPRNGATGSSAPNMTKNGSAATGTTPQPHPATGPAPETLARNERPPIDPDAT